MIDFAGPCFILAELKLDRSLFGSREVRLVSLEPGRGGAGSRFARYPVRRAASGATR